MRACAGCDDTFDTFDTFDTKFQNIALKINMFLLHSRKFYLPLQEIREYNNEQLVMPAD